MIPSLSWAGPDRAGPLPALLSAPLWSAFHDCGEPRGHDGAQLQCNASIGASLLAGVQFRLQGKADGAERSGAERHNGTGNGSIRGFHVLVGHADAVRLAVANSRHAAALRCLQTAQTQAATQWIYTFSALTQIFIPHHCGNSVNFMVWIMLARL